MIAETRQADGSCAQIVYRNNATVSAQDLEALCVKVRGRDPLCWGLTWRLCVMVRAGGILGHSVGS